MGDIPSAYGRVTGEERDREYLDDWIEAALIVEAAWVQRNTEELMTALAPAFTRVIVTQSVTQ
ncbi:hypothetical protein [Streptosporangium sp. NBC_01756]|uniref:hypothetical protein n=1 Tax=Streptosporangium sp. NBC_01756 TaxID=2975950 RepID=UPI002DDBA7F1|nr:hypothetical protein [Streptosporangium sp. NBC_01756]WSC90242.1 hypothetical protein OIE48_19295 [Streptosporangium sp. NBC_01756]